jgi:hypothetical protein
MKSPIKLITKVEPKLEPTIETKVKLIILINYAYDII